MTKKYYLHEIGEEAELAAQEYLQQQGLKFLEKNYERDPGEIDLIMKDHSFLVFVEVRQRTNPNYTNALESVTKSKQRKIIKTALFYLQEKKLLDKIACRFDVVAVNFIKGQAQFDWVKDAFQVKS